MSLEPAARPEIDSSSLEGRNVTLRWSLIDRFREATGFLVQLYGPYEEKLWEETTLLNVLSVKLYNLEYHRNYQAVVRLVNCGSHGPPSKPHHIHIYKQGNRNLPSPQVGKSRIEQDINVKQDVMKRICILECEMKLEW